MDAQTAVFWQTLNDATDPNLYQPERKEHIEASRLEANGDVYYVLKEPLTQSYVRLSETDYALWWQMDGQKTLKDLVYYNLMRYKSLPIGRIRGLVDNLRDNHFLQETPTHLHQQIQTELQARAPESQGRKLINAFLHYEYRIGGLDDFFTPFYRRLAWFFHPIMQFLLLCIIGYGSFLFYQLVSAKRYTLSNGGILGIISFFLANIIVIGIHELAHGLVVKHFKRELHQGGFLLYWGFPAFFVDTRDMWLSPNWQRMLVSWAGPHSGLLIGSLMGIVLTFLPEAQQQTVWAWFFYQMGFIAFLTVFVNLNPLLELDGYFLLMDGLEMPGLRQRAIHFWRQSLWKRVREQPNLLTLWRAFSRTERIFTIFGGLAIVYSTYALYLAGYFWQSRLLPFAEQLWESGIWGQLLVMALTAVLIIPAILSLIRLGWSRIQQALEWLARRDLLGRPDVLAGLIGVPLLAGLPILQNWLPSMRGGALLADVLEWIIHIGISTVFWQLARQLTGSRYQWVIWSLFIGTLLMPMAWVLDAFPLARTLLLLGVAGAVLACGIVAWFTVTVRQVQDYLLMGLWLALGALYSYLFMVQGIWSTLTGSLLLLLVIGLMGMSSLLLNFRQTLFAWSVALLTLAIAAVPLWVLYPNYHLTISTLWLFAGLHYLLLGYLAEFKQTAVTHTDSPAFNERQRLINSFNHFMQSMFSTYQRFFGNRRLASIQTQMISLGAVDADDTIFNIAIQIRRALLLAVDRLDDVAGTLFTRKVGQAAYDSLPWLEAETLGRYVLSETDWGVSLAQGFIQARDERRLLVREAAVFAGLDQDGVNAVLEVLRPYSFREGATIAHKGDDAEYFYLLAEGEVSVIEDGEQTAVLTTGGAFGLTALRGKGAYSRTYFAQTAVKTFVLSRDQFDPLLRADTILAEQVNNGAKERALLKKMPLFRTLSPQQLATVDVRLTHKTAIAGELIFQQGAPRSHLVIVAEGKLEIIHQGENGAEQVIGTLGPGEHFGEYALFADVPYQATCRAATKAKLLLLDEAKFDALVAECDRMSHYVEQIGSGRLIATRRKIGLTAVLS